MAKYLNEEQLRCAAEEGFRKRKPYPWIRIEPTLTEKGFVRLRETLPAVDGFVRNEGVKRAYGQQSHDRYMLHYRAGLELPEPWREFLGELQGREYTEFLRRMLGLRYFVLTFAWHYAWEGCSVSPHCDAARKRATHIFHFNSEEDWDQAWGGETLILDDEGRFPTHSAPGFEELKVVAAHGPSGNGSLLFGRTAHSWHGMRPLRCPPGRLRKIFSVTINVPTFQVLWRRVRGKDPEGFPLAS